MQYIEKGYDLYEPGHWTKSLHGMINYIARTTGIPFDEKEDAYRWFEKHVDQLEDERMKQLFIALKPIRWSWSSSISSRQNLVTERFKIVNTIVPFLNETELRLVKQWKKENSADLWD